MARPKAVLLPCGKHFGTPGEDCQMCADIERVAEQVRNRHAELDPASRPGPTRSASAATAPVTAATAVLGTEVEAPGIHHGLDEATYHRGIVAGEPSLSHSGMKALLAKTASKFKWENDHHEEPNRDDFDLGSATHTLVLGVGPEPYDMGVTDWRKPAVRAERERVKAAGLMPLKSQDYAKAHAMARSVLNHQRAAELLRDGSPEVSMFARDPDSNVMLRARLDWLRDDGRIVDFKTAADANPAHFGRRALDFGYYIQDPTYRHIAEQCGIDVDGFEFVLVESEPPYDVSVCHLGPASKELGWMHAQQAIELFAECMTTGAWPGYPAESVEVDLPYWALRDIDLRNQSESDENPGINAGIFEFLDSINH